MGDAGAVPKFSKPGPGKGTESNKWAMIHLGGIYFFFGATYVVYATFIVTALINERGFGENAAGTFWAVVGGLSILSGPFFGWLSDRLGRRTGMMPGLYPVYPFLCDGGRQPAEPILICLHRHIRSGRCGVSPPSCRRPWVITWGLFKPCGPFGFITLFFGAGQITGPAVAGYLADITGTFNMAFWLCSLLTASAVVLTYFLRPPSHREH